VPGRRTADFAVWKAVLKLQTRRSTNVRELGPYDFDAAAHAYEVIRQIQDDVAAIARHTGMREPWIARIKAHLFYRTHRLDDGVRRFDADPLIVNAWQRLQEGAHTPKDVQLLRHELFESRFKGIFRTDYRTAHAATNRSGRLSGLE
jgi:hypothetical protein